MANSQSPYATIPPYNIDVVDWPKNLYGCTQCDKPCVTGWSEEPLDLRVRTSVSMGPPKTRRRYTAPMRRVSVTMDLPGSEWVELRAFYEGSGLGGTGGTQGGYKFFKFPHPYDGEDHYYRFLSPPKMTNNGQTRISVTMEWEEL